MHFTVYRIAGDRPGEIRRSGFSLLGADKQIMPDEEDTCGLLFEQAVDLERQYVKDGEVVDRPAMPLDVSKDSITADGDDQSVISHIPEGASVQIGEQAIKPTSPTIALTSTIPGSYVVVVSRWPYLDTTVTIEAVS